MVTQTQTKPKGLIARKKLLVISVNEPKPVGDKGAVKLAFQASDETGQALNYFTFKKDLFDTIQKDAALDCEIETSERAWQGDVYTDRKINQIFVNGEPVAQKKSFGGGGYRGKSPEEVASIETQCAMKMVCELAINGKLNDDVVLFPRLIRWLHAKTAGFEADLISKSEKIGKAQNESQPVSDPVDFDTLGRTEEEKQQQSQKRLPPRVFNTLQQFCTAFAQDLHLTTKEVCYLCKVNDLKEIMDYSAAWETLRTSRHTK